MAPQMITAVAQNTLRGLARQRVVRSALAILWAMTLIAGAIGWSSRNTIDRVYDEATRYVAAQGQAAPPNPFLLKPALSYLSNMEIYVPLVGALLALVIGHLAVATESSDGLGRLVFSRPLSRGGYVAGTGLAVAGVLGVAMLGSAVISVAEAPWVNQALLSPGEVGRVAVFYLLSWAYLLTFGLVGMIAMFLTRRRPLAMLTALGAWLVVTFTIPEFTSGLHPVASLNPVVSPVTSSQAFFDVTSHASFLSLSERYKDASAHALALDPSAGGPHYVAWLVPMAAALVLLALLAVALVRRFDYSVGATDA